MLPDRGQIDLVAPAKSLLGFIGTARFELQIFVKTDANFPKPVAVAAGNGDHFRSQRTVALQEIVFQLSGTD